MPNVQRALRSRLAIMASPNWVSEMVELIGSTEKSGFFRWFDSGDLQSIKTLKGIVRIAIALPEIQFWLPTKEYGIVSEYVELFGSFPPNLTVRLSAYMVDKDGPNSLAQGLGLTTSEVRTKNETCPAPKQGNKCLDCRACWNKDVQTVVYKKH
jgi:hypothetical protein